MRILVVDDELIQRITVCDDLRDRGHEVIGYGGGKEALAAIPAFRPDVVVTDLRMPDMDGFALIEALQALEDSPATIVMTAYGSVESAVEAMRKGADDFLTKPFEPDELELRLSRIQRMLEIEQQNRELQRQIRHSSNAPGLVGSSQTVRELQANLEKAARSTGTVLLEGETGTGKDLAVEFIHAHSDRARQPLIKVSCALFAPSTIESELFGHERGAFTGAIDKKIGRIERAHRGTLYLDEVDDIPAAVQVKLLRFLEEGVLERVGGTEEVHIDAHVIAATKRNLSDMVELGEFRRDLFFRLNVFPISIPPLRERVEDVPELFEWFLGQYAVGETPKLEADARYVLLGYSWPGNVREVRNLAERLVMQGCPSTLRASDLPALDQDLAERSQLQSVTPAPVVDGATMPELVDEFERRLIRSALEEHLGNRSAAALSLGIPVTTLKSKIKRLGIDD